MAVVKVRASVHSTEIRGFEINDEGIVISDPVSDFEGILGGLPARIKEAKIVKRGKPL